MPADTNINPPFGAFNPTTVATPSTENTGIPTFLTPTDPNTSPLIDTSQIPTAPPGIPIDPNAGQLINPLASPDTEPQEPAPTDLSQLTGNSNDQQPNPEVYTPSVSSTENLVVPVPTPGASTTNPNDHHHKFPKLLIFLLGGVVLLVVIGASAYFILGLGRNISAPISKPAEVTQPPLTNPPSQVQAQASTPAAELTSPNPIASGATNFGSVAATSAPKAGSAFDLLRQKQQTATNSGNTQ